MKRFAIMTAINATITIINVTVAVVLALMARDTRRKAVDTLTAVEGIWRKK